MSDFPAPPILLGVIVRVKINVYIVLYCTVAYRGVMFSMEVLCWAGEAAFRFTCYPRFKSWKSMSGLDGHTALSIIVGLTEIILL